MRCLETIAALLALAWATVALPAEGYFRHPAIHGDTVVFTAEGDLWSVPVSGGVARRLTTHPAEEAQAAISPDGRHVAFVASYDSSPDVYRMPLAGGAPQRLTHDGGRISVAGFDAEGRVVYATENLSGPSWRRVLRSVDPDDGAVHEWPLADANEAAFDAAGDTLWFTRFGLQLTGDNAREYRGGAMAELWRWRAGAGEAERVAADLDANLSKPMWWNGRLVALSDADGVANLWSMDADGGDRRQLTRHREFEVRAPRAHDGRVVYQLGADLRVLDLRDGSDRAIPVTLVSDFEQTRARTLKKPLDFLQQATFAMNGERVALTARGHVALAGTGPLRRVEIAQPAGARLREAVLSHDGEHVYAITDLDGRSEIWRYPADGSPGGKALTTDGSTHRWRLYPSPDGRWLAHDDKAGALWLLDLGSGRNRKLDETKLGGDDPWAAVVWSADSRHLALVRADTARQLPQVLLREVASGRQAVLTSDRYESFAPAFSRDGRWLYFLSNRSFTATPSAPWGDRNLGPMFDKRTKVYALALQPGNRFPFLPPDELGADDAADDDKDAKDTKDANTGEGKAGPAVAFDGLAERLFEVPLPAGNYQQLALDDKRLYLLDRDAGPEARPRLVTLAIDARGPKPETFMADVAAFALSADAKKLFFRKAGASNGAPPPTDMYIVDAGAKAPAPEDLAKAQVRVGDWALRIEPRDEWRQMFDDAWRMHRQFSFDPGMRGQDWDAVRARYAPLAARVTDRAELDDVLAQMSGEHGILHSQVRGAELRADPETAAPAMLGAALQRADGGVRIARIWQSDAEVPSERGPLRQPGVDVREGDLLVAVNGRPVRAPADVAEALLNQAGQQVLLTLRRDAATRQTVVQPVSADRDAALRYADWVQSTRATVERAGDGRIGYLHLRAMGGGDIAAFAREFYAQFDRDGLIIDVRRNRGGNIDSWVIEKLLRRAWAFWQLPGGGTPFWNMQQTFRGHLVVLADQLTYSDGETFTAGVKALGLGPVIGKRTAGAGIWLSDRNRLADGGIARIAEFAQYDRDGRWLIEGRGVAPDIEIDNPPAATWRGEDAQLAAALGWLERKLAEQPVVQPQPQPIAPRGRPAHDGSR